jgi:hypothetical protein
MFVPNAKPVLEIGGGLGGCLVDFCFPGLLWIKQSGRPLTYWQNILAILLTVFGLACGAVSTFLAVLQAINSFK